MKFTLAVGIVVVLAVLAGGWILSRRSAVPNIPSAPTSDGQPSPADVTRPAPEFTRQTLTGQTVTVSQFRGQKAVIINSWAVWCPFCVQELSDFAALAREYPNDLVILAVDRGEPEGSQRAYLTSLQGQNLLESPLVFLTDPGDEVYRLLGGFGMPVSVFVNKGGEVVFVKNGPMTLDEMRARTRDMLGGA